MPPRGDLQWIELTDFSPGITSNRNLAGGLNVTSTNLAVASPTNTFRCRSLPTGGLGPLPRLQESFALTTPPGNGTRTFRVCGLNTFGSVFADPLVDTDQDHRAEIHLALDHYEPGDDDRYLTWVRETIYNDTPATETIISREFLDTGSAGTARFAYFNRTRMAATDVLEPGQPVTVLQWANNPLGGSDDNRISRAFPDPDSPDTNSTETVGDESDGGYVIAAVHQGRVVVGVYQAWDRGPDTGIFSNENFLWTNVNDSALSSTTPAVFVPELDQSVTDIASMSANALFVVKRLGGGYVLQGDLDDVTVVQLPNIMCPDGSDYVRGANSPIGYIYSAGDAGMYVWNGGDSSRAISPQLDAKAFTGGITLDGANGQCDRWQDLFLAPRNWVMDLNTQAWWQIEDPDVFEAYFWSTSQSKSQTYGAPATFDPADTAFALFQMDDLAYTFSWESHPIWISQDKRMEVRQGIIALQGHGQVTVTVFDPTDDTRVSTHTIDIDQDHISNFRFDVSLDADNLAIRLESSGNDGDGAGTFEAPLIHRAFFGWQTAQPLANANNQ